MPPPQNASQKKVDSTRPGQNHGSGEIGLILDNPFDRKGRYIWVLCDKRPVN